MFLMVFLVCQTGRGSLYLISSQEVYLQKSKCEVKLWVAGNGKCPLLSEHPDNS